MLFRAVLGVRSVLIIDGNGNIQIITQQCIENPEVFFFFVFVTWISFCPILIIMDINFVIKSRIYLLMDMYSTIQKWLHFLFYVHQGCIYFIENK